MARRPIRRRIDALTRLRRPSRSSRNCPLGLPAAGPSFTRPQRRPSLPHRSKAPGDHRRRGDEAYPSAEVGALQTYSAAYGTEGTPPQESVRRLARMTGSECRKDRLSGNIGREADGPDRGWSWPRAEYPHDDPGRHDRAARSSHSPLRHRRDRHAQASQEIRDDPKSAGDGRF